MGGEQRGHQVVVVLVQWSAYSPSTLTIRVQFLVKSKVYYVKYCLKVIKNNQKEAGVGPLLNKKNKVNDDESKIHFVFLEKVNFFLFKRFFCNEDCVQFKRNFGFCSN